MSAPIPTLRVDRLRAGKEKAARQRQVERVRNLAVQLRTLQDESIPAAKRAYDNAMRQVDQARGAEALIRADQAASDAGNAYRSLLRLERKVREQLASASPRGNREQGGSPRGGGSS